MKDERCVRLLQWALPQLRLRWPGFRKVRRQVCRRIQRRMRALDLADVRDYQAYLDENPGEWVLFDSFCRITISRFFRDRRVFAALAQDVMPSLVRIARERGDDSLRVWSAGCGSGEEPYSLALLWSRELQSRFPEMGIDIVATDADPVMIRRARDARYEFGSLKELPEDWRDRAFTREGDSYRLKPEFKRNIDLLEQDVRDAQPAGGFDLVMCRNLAFTYFDEALQRSILKRIADAMHDGAALIIGAHESLPEDKSGLSIWFDHERIYRKPLARG